MKKILTIILFLSLLGNAGLLWLAKQQYQETNALRLDPMQLDVYKTQPDDNGTLGKKRIVFFGDSRALSWPSPELTDFENMSFINRGIGQQTSEQIRLRFQQHVAPLRADTIILQLCINDLKAIPLFPSQRDAIVERCKSNISDIVQQAYESGSKIVLTTLFPLGEVPPERRPFWSDAVAPAIREVNQFIVAYAGSGAPDVTVLDAFTLLQGETDKIKPEYSRDLLHLNARGYEVLNQRLVQLLDASTSSLQQLCEPMRVSGKLNDCLREHILTAVQNYDYDKLGHWLGEKIVMENIDKEMANQTLGALMCNGDAQEGAKITGHQDDAVLIKIIQQLTALGASFDHMPSTVTVLFCAVNKQNSELLDFILDRYAPSERSVGETLNSCLYEGSDTSHVPLYRTIENNDLASARVLVKHGASPNFNPSPAFFDETPLLKALKLGNVAFADWLLDVGASVRVGDKGVCKGKMPLDYAGEIPAATDGRIALINRIERTMALPPHRCDKR